MVTDVFGIGSGEMFVLALVALIALGPERLPDFLRTIGKGLRDLRQARDNFKREAGIDALMREDLGMNEFRNLQRDLRKDMNSAVKSVTSGIEGELAKAGTPQRRFSAADQEAESPHEGVDVDYADRHGAVHVSEAVHLGDSAAKVGGEVEGEKKKQKTMLKEPTMLGLSPVDPYEDLDAARARAAAKVAERKEREAAARGRAAKTSVPPPPPATRPAVRGSSPPASFPPAPPSSEARARRSAPPHHGRTSVPPPPPSRAPSPSRPSSAPEASAAGEAGADAEQSTRDSAAPPPVRRSSLPPSLPPFEDKS